MNNVVFIWQKPTQYCKAVVLQLKISFKINPCDFIITDVLHTELLQPCPALYDPVDCSQAPVSTGFSRQEYWSGFPCLPPRDLPDPGIKLASPAAPALQILYHWAIREAHNYFKILLVLLQKLQIQGQEDDSTLNEFVSLFSWRLEWSDLNRKLWNIKNKKIHNTSVQNKR